ncbi:hypothetical protein GLYMA_03G009300v4 [Glycine max]|uniref:Uncharacterized protein n=2 Tax=Glycine subgen. Soja TaxID=1462606 RepID=K7KC26_SOYBN|nr:hypothetical protein JHK87_005847 [Glycine soja]KAG5070795.1 hypothetical protein JHK86_006006 [Glycine max]KAH1068107.1 hypothetical protein GYH30_005885 [Glycine max]KAH1256075.1 Protein KTI12 [Glycine max]KRH65044.1 hypothetical protein GLYMA_03G009300v4 [Glycine max]
MQWEVQSCTLSCRSSQRIRTKTSSENHRMRGTFLKLTGQTSLSGPPPPSDADSAKRMFIDYLNRELGTS